MNDSRDNLMRDIQLELDSIRLAAICDAGLCSIYRTLFEVALDCAGDRETHDRLRDLLHSIDCDGPFGVYEREWIRKCAERGYGLSQDEFNEWAEREVAEMMSRVELIEVAS